jgi:hypothetical protein
MCFEVALTLATLAQRTLVIPDEQYRRLAEPDEPFRPLHPRDYLDFEPIDQALQPVSTRQYQQLHRNHDDSAALAFESGGAVFCYPHVPHSATPAFQRLRRFAAGRARFLQFTPPQQACETLRVTSPMLEHFYTFFFFADDANEHACRRFIRDYVRLRPELLALGRSIAARLGAFSAAHVRRNDFLDQFPDQAIPDSRILEVLTAYLPKNLPLYVATDDRQHSATALLRRHFNVRVAADFPEIDALAPELLACVEQVVCALANSFVGTRLSTFSAYITRLRGYLGSPDQRVCFIDGCWEPHWDECGQGAFTWERWLECGLPLWGREYREGWECGSP